MISSYEEAPSMQCALNALAEIAGMHYGTDNPDQKQFHATVRETLRSGNLRPMIDLIDAGIPLLRSDNRRGVLTTTSRKWLIDWRAYAGEVLGEAERAA